MQIVPAPWRAWVYLSLAWFAARCELPRSHSGERPKMPSAAAEPMLLQGTLDLLVLRTLAWGPRHGYAVARWIRETSADVILVEDRALYLALHRLEESELIESEWGLSENNRRARYYQLTAAGKRQLQSKAANWTRYVEAVFRILESPEGRVRP